MYSLERHLGGVEVLRRVLCHYYEVQLVQIRRCDDLFKVTRAVSTQKGMNVDDALVLGKMPVAMIDAPLRVK